MKRFVRLILVFLFLACNCTSASAIIVFSENDYGCGWKNSYSEITTQNSFEIGTNIISFLAGNATSMTIMQLQHSGNWEQHPDSIINLANEIFTTIGVSVSTGNAELGVTDLSNVKMLFMTGHDSFSITDLQKTILKEFIDAGGLLFGDDCNNDTTDPSGFESSFRQLVIDLYGESLTVLPSDHLIFSSYHELDGNDFTYTLKGNGTQWGVKPLEFYNPNIDNQVAPKNNDGGGGCYINTLSTFYSK